MTAELDQRVTHQDRLFPTPRTGSGSGEVTTVALSFPSGAPPFIAWVGPRTSGRGGSVDEAALAAGIVAAAGESGCPLLPEHSRDLYTRPGLRGHRLSLSGANGLPVAGRDWSTQLTTTSVQAPDEHHLVIEMVDEAAGLQVATKLESLPGGALRIRHSVTNTGPEPFVVEGLDVVVPLPDSHVEAVDFSGRHERERTPQRHLITDSLYLREGRRGRTGLDSATALMTGPAGFGFGGAPVISASVAWSGNSVLRLERNGASASTLGGGEHILSGEIVLQQGQSYTAPWVVITASDQGMDGVAAQTHQWLRSLPAHPQAQPVTLNVWEAVYFSHDLAQLTDLADRAAAIGVERFVLDDGWFGQRRGETAGLGDWHVSTDVWPDGLGPLVDHVRDLGMSFGLWFEPEMVNPDSDLYRAHPEWVLGTGGREPRQFRYQLVLDLSRKEVVDYLFEQMSDVLSRYDISYVKWDHNRDVLEAGSGAAGGAVVAHRQTEGFYELLDRLRVAHPSVDWESCAGGGGRIDLGVLERTQRVWTSDMTDAHSRQSIQRWTGQIAAPEYLGAHVSATTSHQTGRTFSLDFRAATALFGSFGIEWNLAEATPSELESLQQWVALHKQFRDLLHSGRVVRVDSPDPAVFLHGVVSRDGRQALLAHVQMDESAHNRGVRLRVPGLDPDALFDARWVGPVDRHGVSVASQVPEIGPTGGVLIPGDVLQQVGLWVSRRRPQTILLTHLTAQ